jgi:hypothetical protein
MLGQRLFADPGGTEGDEAGGFGMDIGHLDVEVHAVLHRLRFVDPLQEKRLFPVPGESRGVIR